MWSLKNDREIFCFMRLILCTDLSKKKRYKKSLVKLFLELDQTRFIIIIRIFRVRKVFCQLYKSIFEYFCSKFYFIERLKIFVII